MDRITTLYTKEKITTLVQDFIDKTLPVADWTHEAHLLVALWHLKQYSKAEATCYLRSRIISYNEVVGTKNSPRSGYHETMTLFWIWVVDEFLKRNEGELAELANRFLSSKYAERRLPFQFYTKAKIVSIEARARWTAPDLQSLNFEKI